MHDCAKFGLFAGFKTCSSASCCVVGSFGPWDGIEFLGRSTSLPPKLITTQRRTTNDDDDDDDDDDGDDDDDDDDDERRRRRRQR